MPLYPPAKRHSFSPPIQVQHQSLFSMRHIPCVAARGAGRGGNPYPPTCIASPAPDDRERCYTEALRIRDRLIDLLRLGGPLFEEGAGDTEPTPETGSSLPTMADEHSHLDITTWGGLYEEPQVLWEQCGGCAAQTVAIAVLSDEPGSHRLPVQSSTTHPASQEVAL